METQKEILLYLLGFQSLKYLEENSKNSTPLFALTTEEN